MKHHLYVTVVCSKGSCTFCCFFFSSLFSLLLCMLNENFRVRIQAIMHINLYHLLCNACAISPFRQLLHCCNTIGSKAFRVFFFSTIFQINLKHIYSLPIEIHGMNLLTSLNIYIQRMFGSFLSIFFWWI